MVQAPDSAGPPVYHLPRLADTPPPPGELPPRRRKFHFPNCFERACERSWKRNGPCSVWRCARRAVCSVRRKRLFFSQTSYGPFVVPCPLVYTCASAPGNRGRTAAFFLEHVIVPHGGPRLASDVVTSAPQATLPTRGSYRALDLLAFAEGSRGGAGKGSQDLGWGSSCRLLSGP